ncbi:MAG: FecR domain-containing protein, partial [Bacteroidota bacterium]
MNWKNDDTFLARWLNGELSEEEKRAFEASEEGQEFVDMMKASALIEPTPYQTDTEFSKLSDRIDSSPRQKVVLWKQKGFQMAVAASLVLLMATIYLFTTGSPTIETGFSEQEIVTLSDGSEVKMNAASVLSYNTKDWDKKRTLNLSGEAFFKVQKGATFVVETANGDVQVLGTSFNVKSRGNVLNVACYTGKVEVRSTNVTKQLLPG